MKQQRLFLAIIAALLCVAPTLAYASGTSGNSIQSVLCTVVNWLWGPLGSVVAMLAVIVLGITAMFGRIAIPNILITMSGIAMIFGAPTLMTTLGLGNGCAGAGTAMGVTDIVNSKLYVMLSCITSWFTGPYGKALASLAIITLGLFAVNGRISYHQAIIVCAGIATMMGSFSILHSMGVPVVAVSGPTSAGAGIFNLNLLNSNCTTNTAFEFVFCNVVSWFQSPMSKGIATLAIVILGIGALFGKIGWGVSTVAGVGIALLMGANSIVNSLGANTADCVQHKYVDGRAMNLKNTTVVNTVPTNPQGPVVSTTTPQSPINVPGTGKTLPTPSGSGSSTGSGSSSGLGPVTPNTPQPPINVPGTGKTLPTPSGSGG